MAKHDWIADLMQTCVYDGAGRKRRVNFEKVYELAAMNGGEETVEKMRGMHAENRLTAGQAVMLASIVLRGAARRNKGVTVVDKKGGNYFYPAPSEWLAHYGIAA